MMKTEKMKHSNLRLSSILMVLIWLISRPIVIAYVLLCGVLKMLVLPLLVLRARKRLTRAHRKMHPLPRFPENSPLLGHLSSTEVELLKFQQKGP